jgi:hypothetical protein
VAGEAAAAAGRGGGVSGAVGAALVAAMGRGGEGEAEAEGADGGEVTGTKEEAPAASRGVGAVSAVDGPVAAAAVCCGCTGHRMLLWGGLSLTREGGGGRIRKRATSSEAAAVEQLGGFWEAGGATGRERGFLLKLGTRYGAAEREKVPVLLGVDDGERPYILYGLHGQVHLALFGPFCPWIGAAPRKSHSRQAQGRRRPSPPAAARLPARRRRRRTRRWKRTRIRQGRARHRHQPRGRAGLISPFIANRRSTSAHGIS